jgi:hypothetical protein
LAVVPLRAMSSAVMAWVCPIAAFTLATLTMEVQMEAQIHVETTMCVVMLAAAWAEMGKSKSAAHITEMMRF